MNGSADAIARNGMSAMKGCVAKTLGRARWPPRTCPALCSLLLDCGTTRLPGDGQDPEPVRGYGELADRAALPAHISIVQHRAQRVPGGMWPPGDDHRPMFALRGRSPFEKAVLLPYIFPDPCKDSPACRALRIPGRDQEPMPARPGGSPSGKAAPPPRAFPVARREELTRGTLCPFGDDHRPVPVRPGGSPSGKVVPPLCSRNALKDRLPHGSLKLYVAPVLQIPGRRVRGTPEHEGAAVHRSASTWLVFPHWMGKADSGPITRGLSRCAGLPPTDIL